MDDKPKSLAEFFEELFANTPQGEKDNPMMDDTYKPQTEKESDPQTPSEEARAEYEEAKPEIEGFLELAETILDEQGEKVGAILAKAIMTIMKGNTSAANSPAKLELIKLQAESRAIYLATLYEALQKAGLNSGSARELTVAEASHR